MKKINDNTTLYYVEANNWHHDENDNEIIDVLELSFQFYDCQYMVYVKAADLEEKSGFGKIQMQGDSRLFESFEELCENQIWALITNECKQYLKMHHS